MNNIELRINELQVEKSDIEHRIKSVKSTIGKAFFDGDDNLVKQLEKDKIRLDKDLIRVSSAINSGFQTKATTDYENKVNKVKDINKRSEELVDSFLFNIEKITNGSSQLLKILNETKLIASELNQNSKKNLIKIHDLPCQLISEISKQLGIPAKDLEEIANRQSFNREASILIRYHDLKVQSHLPEPTPQMDYQS